MASVGAHLLRPMQTLSDCWRRAGVLLLSSCRPGFGQPARGKYDDDTPFGRSLEWHQIGPDRTNGSCALTRAAPQRQQQQSLLVLSASRQWLLGVDVVDWVASGGSGSGGRELSAMHSPIDRFRSFVLVHSVRRRSTGTGRPSCSSRREFRSLARRHCEPMPAYLASWRACWCGSELAANGARSTGTPPGPMATTSRRLAGRANATTTIR